MLNEDPPAQSRCNLAGCPSIGIVRRSCDSGGLPGGGDGLEADDIVDDHVVRGEDR